MGVDTAFYPGVGLPCPALVENLEYLPGTTHFWTTPAAFVPLDYRNCNFAFVWVCR
jgi:hypothetical protein